MNLGKNQIAVFFSDNNLSMINTCVKCIVLLNREYAQSNTSETSDTKNASSDRKVSCDICGNSFVNKYILDTHKRRLHLKRSHECNICKKAFAIERELKRHIQLHNDKKPFKCRICNRGYASENYLRYHMITHIPGKGQFNCEICDERFLVESLFKRHVLTKHTDHECTVCSAKFRSENTLKIHMIKHTTAKNIPCDKCDKMYYIEKDLRTHQKKKHPKPQTNAQSEISVQMKTDTAKLTTQILISTSTIQQL